MKSTSVQAITNSLEDLKVIGFIETVYNEKNATPRQASCDNSRAILKIDSRVFNNPGHSLIGLSDFSHIWLIYLFHKHTPNNHAKVRPPRLNGKKVGVFSTRSPHRPNPIGLSLVQIIRIAESEIHLSGVDLLNGTPVLDIKPFIPQYDIPASFCLNKPNVESKDESNFIFSTESTAFVIANDDKIPARNDDIDREHDNSVESVETFCSSGHGIDVNVPSWLNDTTSSAYSLSVGFTPSAIEQIRMFSVSSKSPEYRLRHLQGSDDLMNNIKRTLENDPRSVYRRSKCLDRLYYFTVDIVHITCWFDNSDCVEVLKVQPICLSQAAQHEMDT